MIIDTVKKKGFLIKLLEASLKLWIKSKCKKIENLKLKINSINAGKIYNVNLSARQVNFKDLYIDNIDLSTEIIRFRKTYIPTKIYFEEDFLINSKLTVSEKSINKILQSNQWKWLGHLISNKLLKMETIKNVKIKNDLLELTGSENHNKYTRKASFKLDYKEKEIILINDKTLESLSIPIEDDVLIDNAFLANSEFSTIINFKVKGNT